MQPFKLSRGLFVMYRLTQSYIPQAKHKIELERCRAEVDVVQKAKEEEMEEVHKRCDLALAYIFWGRGSLARFHLERLTKSVLLRA